MALMSTPVIVRHRHTLVTEPLDTARQTPRTRWTRPVDLGGPVGRLVWSVHGDGGRGWQGKGLG